MALQARKGSIESFRDPRGHTRYRVRLQSEVSTSAPEATPILIHNLSQKGLLIEMVADVPYGSLLEVNIPHAGTRAAKVVWRDERLFGCEFVEDLPVGAVSAARLLASFEIPERGGGVENYAEGSKERASPRASFWMITALSLGSWAILAIVIWAVA